MQINRFFKSKLAWLMSIDVYFYALSFPIVMCIVNKQLSVNYYVIPSLITSGLGSLLNLKITEKKTMAYLYEHWFYSITFIDAFVWIGYFALWISGIFPDNIYPISCAIMHLTTVELSRVIRQEQANRIFKESQDLTEFNNARSIICSMLNAFGSITILVFSFNSFQIARYIILFAMIIDNLIVVLVENRLRKGTLHI